MLLFALELSTEFPGCGTSTQILRLDVATAELFPLCKNKGQARHGTSLAASHTRKLLIFG